MMNVHSKVVPVVLAGGVGSRLWPLSRELHPKPFIELDDGQSLIQKTYIRALGLERLEEIITVTNRDLYFYTKDQYLDVSVNSLQHSFFLEPFGRNSTAAVALAAYYARIEHGDDCVLLILPADHLIDKQMAFIEAVTQAIEFAAQGKLVTFGIKPDAPKTGFGYIEAEGFEVKRFVEKPDLEKARKYVSSGKFFWNSGMFCMRADVILEEMAFSCPDIVAHTTASFDNAAFSKGKGWQQYEISSADFAQVREVSIDYAVFEKSNNVAVIPCDIGWSDIGSWNEFGALYPLDQAGNNVTGNVVLEDVKDCIIHSENRLVAALGLEAMIVADTPDALLIAPKDRAQEVRSIVSVLKKRKDSTFQLFPTIHRPWGNYTVLLEGTGFKLKRIELKPGAALSLQSHKYRSEHWVVIDGIAKITNENNILKCRHDQSVYIPAGNKHRLENPGTTLLTLIEVQCGDYLREDDIVIHQDASVKHRVLNLNCFKAYDVRGKLGEELNEEVSYRIGRAYAQHLGAKCVVVGHDVRLSSVSLKEALAKGLMDGGSDVLDIGLAGSEQVYFAAFHLDVDGGIEVTASHNPIDYNGMKFVGRGAKPIGGDSGLQEIQRIAEREEFIDPDTLGAIKKISILDDYIHHLLSYIEPARLRPLKLVVNAGNGAAGHVIDAIESRFNMQGVPIEFIKIHHEPDGYFPNGIPNPLLPENRAATAEAVIAQGADIGIAWDGDFDRCFFFDEHGQFIEGYYIVGLLAEAFLKKYPSEKIIHDPRLIWNTVAIVREMGGIPIQSRTGHAFIKERMRAENAVYGGEMSAHHYFRDFAYCDSGMIPWLLIAELLSMTEKKLSQLVGERIDKYPCSGEMNYKVQETAVCINRVKKYFIGHVDLKNVEEMDGLSMEFEHWRFNLRGSNTEPLLRLNLEACGGSMSEVRKYVRKIAGIISNLNGA